MDLPTLSVALIRDTDPVFIGSLVLSRADARCLERMMVAELANSRGVRPSGRTEGSAPAVVLLSHSAGVSHV